MKRDQLMSLALLFHYLMLNMFRILVHPIWVACDLFVELYHGLYCSGSMCVGVTVWFGWGGVVSLCRLKQCFTTHEITQQFARSWIMDVLTSETCWALNKEMKRSYIKLVSLYSTFSSPMTGWTTWYLTFVLF